MTEPTTAEFLPPGDLSRRVQSLEDTQRELAIQTAQRLNEHRSMIDVAAASGPEPLPAPARLPLHRQIHGFAWTAMSAAAFIIGALGTAGKLDTFAVGGLVIGPALIALKPYLDGLTREPT